MDYGRLIQDSIEFIEERLTEELDVGEIVGQTYFSRFYYQRLFSALVGESLMEYVKKRRLSLAGRELAETNTPVIDIALKYGYGSHEGFTRAFKAYHGITPAQCRKYRLFHVFDKKYVLGEAGSMQANSLINVPDLITEESARRLAENTDALAGMLEDFCKGISGLAEMAVEKEKESGVPGDVFTQIARVIGSLAGRTEKFTREIREFMYSVIEKSQRVCFAELAGQVMFTIQCVEDTAFQMNIITFVLKLSIERTGEPYRELLTPVGDACLSLTSALVGENDKIIELARDFLTLVLQDMQIEAEERKNHVTQTLREVTQAVTSVMAFVRDEAEKAGACGGGFCVMAEEIRMIADEQAQWLDRLETMDDGHMAEWLAEAEKSRKLADDHAFRVNILAFAADIELSSASNEKGLRVASEQIRGLAGKLNGASFGMRNILDEIKQLAELAESSVTPPSVVPYEKELDDIAFQGNILYFYMKMEYAKLKYATVPEEQWSALDEYVKRAGEVITALHALAAEAAGGPKARLSAAAVADEISSLCADIKGTTERMGDQGGAFAYIALEYESFAGRVERVGETYV